MSEKENVLLQFLIQFVYVIIALFVSFLFFLFFPNNSDAFFEWQGFKVSGAFAGFIIIVYVLNIIGPMKLIKEKFKKIDDSNKIVAKVLSINSSNDFESVFDGFAKKTYFRAFNAPFQLENINPIIDSSSNKIFKKRINNKIHSCYLFFSESNFIMAKSRFDILQEKTQIFVKLHLVKNNSEKPGYTYFLGEKENGQSCIILYPKATVIKGIPSQVIYIEGAQVLFDLLNANFNSYLRECKENN